MRLYPAGALVLLQLHAGMREIRSKPGEHSRSVDGSRVNTSVIRTIADCGLRLCCIKGVDGNLISINRHR